MSSHPPTFRTAFHRWGSFAIAIFVIGVVWLAVLPLIGRQSQVAEHIATQQKLGIDPSAMFYSELEILPPIAHHVERLREANPAEFWSFSRSDAPELKLTRLAEER